MVVVGVVSKQYWWPQSKPTRSYQQRKKVATNDLSYQQLPGDLLTEVGDKWKRPLHNLPVHVDIPRLARKISIYTAPSPSSKEPVLIGKDDVNASNNDKSSAAHNDNLVMKDLILTLAKHLGETDTQQDNIDSNFLAYFKKTADPSQALADFLASIVGAESQTAKVLKACNQSVLAPGVLKLKFAIGNHYPYKDSRGSWRIEIVVGPDWVTVEHMKREKSFDDTPQNYFEFSWALKLTFDKNMENLQETELYIDDATLGDSMNTTIKQKVYDILSPWFKPKVPKKDQ